jgi:hypothetical protein
MLGNENVSPEYIHSKEPIVTFKATGARDDI